MDITDAFVDKIVGNVKVMMEGVMLEVLHLHALYDDEHFYKRIRHLEDEAIITAREAFEMKAAHEATRKNYEEMVKSVYGGPVKMVLYCPAGHQHIDEGEWATKPHKTHLCVVPVCYFCGNPKDICIGSDCDQGYRFERLAKPCGKEWRPAVFQTVGVKAL